MKKLINGQIVDMTAEEISARQAEEKEWNDGAFDRAMENLRAKRNRLLAETDFYALSDVSLSDKMKTYRQELRDITKTFKSMNDKDFKFPEKPKD